MILAEGDTEQVVFSEIKENLDITIVNCRGTLSLLTASSFFETFQCIPLGIHQSLWQSFPFSPLLSAISMPSFF